MQDIFIAAKLQCSSKIVVLPVHFIHELDYVKTFNNRLNRNQIHLIFWSQDHNKEPDFNLPVSLRFNEKTDACFHVKLLQAFRKCIEKYSFVYH